MTALAIMVLGPASMPLARRLRAAMPGSRIHVPRQRADASTADADAIHEDFGEQLRQLYAGPDPVVALCAAGIIIRALAPRLVQDTKQEGAAVLALAADGSSIVPLLGGLQGVNGLAREIAAALDCQAAITTSGELRFGTCLLQPPDGYALEDIEHGKHLVSGLLAGGTVAVHGRAPWLDEVDLPRAEDPSHHIDVSPARQAVTAGALRIYPRCVAMLCLDARAGRAQLLADLRRLLERAGLAEAAVAVLLMPARAGGQQAAAEAAAALGAELRLLDGEATDALQLLRQVLPQAQGVPGSTPAVAAAVAQAPLRPAELGRRRGRLSVVGLGPGDADWMIPAARKALDQATDILGYATYVEMAGPLRADQRRHPSDNREELQRAAHAFALAAQGRQVAMVSSGDPGIFAMAAAMLEALEAAEDPVWREVELEIVPGVSAAMATAALAGAPLGHDFCLISLSDNLKPWSVIERRLQLAAEADLVMGFYNPISRHRPWQLARALDIVRQHRAEGTPVLLGRDITRPGGQLRSLPLQALQPDMVDMRTLVIVGSSTTRAFPRTDGRDWVYTPRSYPFDSAR